MKPLLVSHSDLAGGAARAAYRLHRALRSAGLDSTMRVRVRLSDDWTVEGPRSSIERAANKLRAAAGAALLRLQAAPDVNLRSGNWMPSQWAGVINASTADVVNLHWVAGEALSIEDIGRIRKPVVWTLHDMWPFSGTEHYASDDVGARWRLGYTATSRPTGARGLDLDRWGWRRKRRAWRRPMHIVAPSQWLARCARESTLFDGWPITVIPNPLDTAVFRPHPRAFARDVLRLPQDKQLVLFGAMGGSADPRKGYPLLREALHRLAARTARVDLQCVVFGQSTPAHPPDLPWPTHWFGPLHDDALLALLYSAADVMVVPSLQENLPQTATEAQACGCPVVAFDCTGLPDAVIDGETGYLVAPYQPDAMAAALHGLLDSADIRRRMGEAATRRAAQSWASAVVSNRYSQVFDAAVGGGRLETAAARGYGADSSAANKPG